MYTINPLYRKIGLSFIQDKAQFRIWAPLAQTISFHDLSNDQSFELEKEDDQYWLLQSSEITSGIRYRIKIDSENLLPDPASLSQPDGVHGDSQAANLKAFSWNDSAWKNPPLQDYIIYELHTGLFSIDGTFNGLTEKLPHLVLLGITAIEIMPVAQYAGTRNWGYDGVFPFAVQNSYGGPEGLMQLVNACHKHGLAVILDVVYNHLGPEGNYHSQSGPWFTEKYSTPWGAALNFDDAWCDGVRNYFIENALMWFRDFHIDALRMDAVHAIKDFSAVHILQEIKQEVLKLSGQTGKVYNLIVECDLNDPRFIYPFEKGGFQMDSQWSDEFHHALRVCAGIEKLGYYEDFSGILDLAKVYQEGYVYTGEYSEERKRKFGRSPIGCNDSQFVVFSQNHDQVGNRMLGERSSVLHGKEIGKLMAAAVLLSPFIPLLFMGEEYGENNPFLYFVSHGDQELNRLVREGRKAEFKAFQGVEQIPDPSSVQTYENSRPSFDIGNELNSQMFRYYQQLIHIRKSEQVLQTDKSTTLIRKADEANQLLWIERSGSAQSIHIILNFSPHENHIPISSSYAEFQLLLDSSSSNWGGKNHMDPVFLNGIIQVQAQSALIFRENHA